jgi:hypothetical protein
VCGRCERSRTDVCIENSAFAGEGQGREKDAKITIYKKTEDTYMLKLKTSREFYSKVSDDRNLFISL